jgi:DNA-binding MarR family transcriptional regulator
MDLDPRRLLTLQAVSRHGGVSGAADALHISPSAVSQQMNSLEGAAGIALFDRSERSIRLTPAGELLLGAAQQIEDALDQAEAELGRRQQVIEGTVVIGSFQSAIISLISPCLAELNRLHPKLSIQHPTAVDLDIRRCPVGCLASTRQGPSVRTNRCPSMCGVSIRVGVGCRRNWCCCCPIVSTASVRIERPSNLAGVGAWNSHHHPCSPGLAKRADRGGGGSHWGDHPSSDLTSWRGLSLR